MNTLIIKAVIPHFFLCFSLAELVLIMKCNKLLNTENQGGGTIRRGVWLHRKILTKPSLQINIKEQIVYSFCVVIFIYIYREREKKYGPVI